MLVIYYNIYLNIPFNMSIIRRILWACDTLPSAETANSKQYFWATFWKAAQHDAEITKKLNIIELYYSDMIILSEYFGPGDIGW